MLDILCPTKSRALGESPNLFRYFATFITNSLYTFLIRGLARYNIKMLPPLARIKFLHPLGGSHGLCWLYRQPALEYPVS